LSLVSPQERAFWQPCYYDFNVFRERKHEEKLPYIHHIHRNPVEGKLVQSPELWRRSSFRYYWLGEKGPPPKAIAFWIALYGTYANWFFTTLAAVLGTAAANPISSAGHHGQPWQESLVGAGFLTVSFAIIAAALLVLWASGQERRSKQRLPEQTNQYLTNIGWILFDGHEDRRKGLAPL
jgi:hypothetical protein